MTCQFCGVPLYDRKWEEPAQSPPGTEQHVHTVERCRDHLAVVNSRLRERVLATAEVGCVNSPAGRRWPMRCLPRDPCSFCRARALLESM